MSTEANERTPSLQLVILPRCRDERFRSKGIFWARQNTVRKVFVSPTTRDCRQRLGGLHEKWSPLMRAECHVRIKESSVCAPCRSSLPSLSGEERGLCKATGEWKLSYERKLSRVLEILKWPYDHFSSDPPKLSTVEQCQLGTDHISLNPIRWTVLGS